MFGISPLGWIHTISSLPALTTAIYMFARHGRIVPRSASGRVYFCSMLAGTVTVYPIAHMPVSYGIATITLLLLLIGYGVSRLSSRGRMIAYVETVCLTMTGFFLFVPTVSEFLRRVPNGHPFVTDTKSPLFLGAQGLLFVMLIVGLTAQVVHLRRRQGSAASQPLAG